MSELNDVSHYFPSFYSVSVGLILISRESLDEAVYDTTLGLLV